MSNGDSEKITRHFSSESLESNGSSHGTRYIDDSTSGTVDRSSDSNVRTIDIDGGDTIAIDPSAIEGVLEVTPADVSAVSSLSFARNVFIPLTTACRYTCTYCTYFDPPGDASLLSPDEVRSIVEMGADAGCTEALFTFGDDPDDRYTSVHEQLETWGHDSIHSYLREACEIALEAGLLPHSNPGDQTRKQMESVAPVNASMGVMLETTADVAAHSGKRVKTPSQRLATLRTAGELGVPFTTGILVGIGEDWTDRAESLLAIRALHEHFGHIQEVIIQPVVENDRWKGGQPSLETLRRTVAMARVCLPETVSVQVPPNLAPAGDLLDCGIDDLGGVSPVTDDHINPEYAWPELAELKEIAETGNVPLVERLPVHRRYMPESYRPPSDADISAAEPETGQWLSDRIRAELTAETQAGERYRSVAAGESIIGAE